VTVRELPISKKVAGVEMRLIKGGIRELHWHVGSEWAYMTAGSARITGVDSNGRAFVDDVSEGDLWLFPGGIPIPFKAWDRMVANFCWSSMTATSTSSKHSC